MFWDQGPEALRAFVNNHKCNSLCCYLELDDLSDFDVDKVAKWVADAQKVGNQDQAEKEPSGSDAKIITLGGEKELSK